VAGLVADRVEADNALPAARGALVKTLLNILKYQVSFCGFERFVGIERIKYLSAGLRGS